MACRHAPPRAARRTPEHQGKLAIGRRLFREIVIDNQRVHAVVAEILADGATRIRRDVLQGRRVGRRGRHDDGVVHRPVFLQGAHHLRERGALLAGTDVDAIHVGIFLVDDGVNRDGGFAGLPVADDEFALSAANRHHAVNRLDPGLQRFFHGLAIDHAGGDDLEVLRILGFDGAFSVDGLTQRVHDAAGQRLADRHLNDAGRTPDLVTLFNGAIIA